MMDWLEDLLCIGMGRVAIQQLALIEAGAVNKPITKCPCCKTEIKEFAVSCPKCRMRL